MKRILCHKKAILKYSFLAIFLVLPFVDILAPSSLGLCLILALLFGSKNNLYSKLKDNPPLVFLAAYFLLAIISLSYSIDIDKTTGKIGKHIAFLLIPIVFILVHPSQALLQTVKRVFIIACVIFCVFSLLKLGYNYAVRPHQSHWYNFVQTAMYHKYMPEDAMYLNTAFIFLLFGKFKRHIKLFISFLFVCVIILFGVRLGLFLYFLVLGIYILKNISFFLNFKALFIAVIGILMMIFLIRSNSYVNDKIYDTLSKVGFNTQKKVSEIGEKYHDISLRNKIWNTAIDVIKERPLLGYGGGAEKTILNKVYKHKGYDTILGFHAHNQVLSSTIQYGVLGFFILFFIYFFMSKKIIKQRHLEHGILLLVMLASMSTESYLELQQGIFYFGVFVGLITYSE